MDHKIPLDRDSFEQIVATASILQQMQKRAEHLKTSAQDGTSDLTNLIEVQREIQTGTLPPEEALRRIVSLALQLIPAKGAGVWLSAGTAFLYRAGAGIISDDENLRALILSRLQTDESLNHSPEPELGVFAASGSFIVAPIFQGPKIAGALAVFTENSNIFSERHVAISRLLAGLAADAIDKASSAHFRQMVSAERAVVLKVIESMVPPLSGLLDLKEHSFPSSAAIPASATRQIGAPVSQRREAFNLENVMNDETLAFVRAEIEKFDDQRSSEFQADVLPAGTKPTTVFPAVETNTIAVPAKILIATDTTAKPAKAVAVSRRPESSMAKVQPSALNRRRFGVSLFTPLFQFPGSLRRLVGPAHARVNAGYATSAGIMIVLLAGLIIARKTGVPKLQPMASTEGSNRANTTTSEPVDLAFSHKRVTDPAIANALSDLSPFEIAGLRRQAKYGDASAAFILGMAYETGYGVRQNCARAAYWVGEAADDGNAAAEYNLGLRYKDGDGIARDTEKADYWFRKAAAQKYPKAQGR